jgi:predicted DNA-binding transcriptional regulator AlpA
VLIRSARATLLVAAATVQHMADGAQYVADGLTETVTDLRVLADHLEQLLSSDSQRTYVTINEVAQLAGVAPSTVRAYLARGRIPPPNARRGKSPVWRVETINEWLASHGKVVDRNVVPLARH